MDSETKPPLQPAVSNNGHNTPAPPARAIEEIYQRRSQIDHILLRPETFIGSTIGSINNMWVYEGKQVVQKKINFIPGLYNIFDEILCNAADNKQRDPSMDSLKVDIDAENNSISVYNNGEGVPVEIHKKEKIYVPEMVFGNLLTSSNYDDRVKKTTGGRNGFGAKLTNIFSKEFVVETADGRRNRKYKQVFLNNMKGKGKLSITRCKAGDNWTKVSFKPDLARFGGMTKIEDDMVALMKRRVVDLAGCLGESVKVELNGEEVPVKSFDDYVDLYHNSPSAPREKFYTRIKHKVDRWEVHLLIRKGNYEHVSFVNGVATTKGGSHVDYITDQITNHVKGIIEASNKNPDVQRHAKLEYTKSFLWVFINVLIENPAFNSQTKEILQSSSSSFGSTCKLSEGFLKDVAKSGLVSMLISDAEHEHKREVEKHEEEKKEKITNIPRLDDATQAGGENFGKRTLILIHGDSDKALATAGISAVDQDLYGVYQMKDKSLDLSDLNLKDTYSIKPEVNAEMISITRVLGLDWGVEYKNAKSLRYGRLMIMTDQDHEGFHIKGLFFNFIHKLWPSLLKIPSFLFEFRPPIVKATNKDGTVLSFYSTHEYKSWKNLLDGNTSDWSIKHYKGLGTNTPMEVKEYFKNLEKHRKEFVWAGEKDGEAIELAFGINKIQERHNWIEKFKPGTCDLDQKRIKYRDFVNRDLIQYYMADIQRSIPSVVDGLKPDQRKILFCSFKRNFVQDAKVEQFSGYVFEHSAYHHDKERLATAIMGMAQGYVGSNNINLLQPKGQFGSRHQGGKDHASVKYTYTCLSPLTRLLFPKDDDILLDYLEEEGQSIEPAWYMPIIPMVLANGSKGASGEWTSSIPNHNPRDIIKNVKHLLNDEPMEPMHPWYRGFKGSICRTPEGSYTSNGIIEEVNNTTLRISELPIHKSTQEYKEVLASMKPFIKDFTELYSEKTIHFEVMLPENNLIAAKEEGLLKKFKLTTAIDTNNMLLFDENGVLKKYDNPEQILKDFFYLRLEYYEKRKKVLLEVLELERLKLENIVRFILEVIEGRIVVFNRTQADLILELKKKGFAPFPKKTNTVETSVPEETKKAEESDYEYLLSLAIGTFTMEKVQDLCNSKDKLNDQVNELKNATPKSLWLKDLHALENELNVQEKNDAQADDAERELFNAQASSKHHNSSALENGDEEIEILEQNQWLDACNSASSMNKSSMKTEVTRVHAQKNGLSQDGAAAQKTSAPIEISDDEDDCVNEQMQGIKEEEMGVENNTQNLEAQTTRQETMGNNEGSSENLEVKVEATQFGTTEVATETTSIGRETRSSAMRKREMVEKHHQPEPSFELISDISNLVENGESSPQKKVQKTSDYQFRNKRSSPRFI